MCLMLLSALQQQHNFYSYIVILVADLRIQIRWSEFRHQFTQILLQTVRQPQCLYLLPGPRGHGLTDHLEADLPQALLDPRIVQDPMTNPDTIRIKNF